MKLEGLPAIVTGGASGLGAATARMFAQGGARVAIFDTNIDQGVALARAIGGAFVEVDVTDERSVVRGLNDAENRHGTARILVNCAGIAPVGRAVDRDGLPLPLAEFRKVVEVNLIGTFNVASKFAARAMQTDRIGEERGVIVCTASVAAFEGQIGQTAYAASKNGVVGLTLPLARELARSAIRVVTIAPGLFETPLLASLSAAVQQSLAEQVPFPSRPGHPDEYAQMVAAVIATPMLNGETIRLDGAIRVPPR